MKRKRKTIVLLSGGLDSSTILFMAKSKGYECIALTFDYGQRHNREIESAKKIAKLAECKLCPVNFKLPHRGSSLLNKAVKVPTPNSVAHIKKRVPSTYVPARNTIFLSFAVSMAEATGADNVFIGANILDFSGYPDCRPEYYKAFEKVIRLGTKRGNNKPIRIMTPLIYKSKKEIIEIGLKLGVPYEYTWSCYQGGKRPCGKCDSCLLREKAFKQVGVEDPAL